MEKSFKINSFGLFGVGSFMFFNPNDLIQQIPNDQITKSKCLNYLKGFCKNPSSISENLDGLKTNYNSDGSIKNVVEIQRNVYNETIYNVWFDTMLTNNQQSNQPFYIPRNHYDKIKSEIIKKVSEITGIKFKTDKSTCKPPNIEINPIEIFDEINCAIPGDGLVSIFRKVWKNVLRYNKIDTRLNEFELPSDKFNEYRRQIINGITEPLKKGDIVVTDMKGKPINVTVVNGLTQELSKMYNEDILDKIPLTINFDTIPKEIVSKLDYNKNKINDTINCESYYYEVFPKELDKLMCESYYHEVFDKELQLV